MKKQTLLCFALTAVVLFASAAFLPSNESEIYDQVVRLHILANSDSERDRRRVGHFRVTVTQSCKNRSDSHSLGEIMERNCKYQHCARREVSFYSLRLCAEFMNVGDKLVENEQKCYSCHESAGCGNEGEPAEFFL